MTDKKSTKKDEPDELDDSQLRDLQTQIDELTEALQRERADATNVRRRAEEDRLKLATMHKASVVRSLLPVIDNFERALKHVPDELAQNDYIKGIQGVVTQFEKILNELGVTRIETVGKEFDPRFHEAVVMDDKGGDHEIVSEELQSGYTLQDEVLRHAMVKVQTQ